MNDIIIGTAFVNTQRGTVSLSPLPIGEVGPNKIDFHSSQLNSKVVTY